MIKVAPRRMQRRMARRHWLFVVTMVVCHAIAGCKRAERLREAEVEGVWRVDRELVYPPGSVAEDFFALTLTLRGDSTFEAANVPAGLFFNYPAAARYAGSWALLFDEAAGASKLRLTFPAAAGSDSGTYDAPAEVKRGKVAFRLGGKGSIYLTKPR